MSTAIYLRVSTDDQSTEAQLQSINHYLKVHNITEFARYADEGISGLEDNREALDRLVADCKAGLIKLVIIGSLDRLARRTRRTLELMDLFQAYGTRVILLRENVDISTPQGKFFLAIMAATAELEHATIKSRCRAGIVAAKARGVHCGRPEHKRKSEIIRRVCTGATAKDLMQEFNISRATAFRFIGGARGRHT
jgi:DNA invertase Pin-like site-specific DNA recombinase